MLGSKLGWMRSYQTPIVIKLLLYQTPIVIKLLLYQREHKYKYSMFKSNYTNTQTYWIQLQQYIFTYYYMALSISSSWKMVKIKVFDLLNSDGSNDNMTQQWKNEWEWVLVTRPWPHSYTAQCVKQWQLSK